MKITSNRDLASCKNCKKAHGLTFGTLPMTVTVFMVSVSERRGLRNDCTSIEMIGTSVIDEHGVDGVRWRTPNVDEFADAGKVLMEANKKGNEHHNPNDANINRTRRFEEGETPAQSPMLWGPSFVA